MDLVGFLYGFGVLQGIVMAAILLFARSGHRLANAFMAGLLIVIGLNLLQNWLIRIGFYVEHPGGSMLIPPLDFAWGPLLYLYAYSLTNRSVSWRQAIHFLPAIMALAAFSSFLTYSFEEQRNFISYVWSQRTDEALSKQFVETIPAFWRVWVNYHLQGSFFALHFGVYCFLVLHQIRHHNRRLQQHFSSLEHMNLRWLRILTSVCLLFLALYLAFNRSQLILVGHYDVNALAPSAPFIFLVFLAYIIGIAAIFQPSLIRGVEAALDSDPNRERPTTPSSEEKPRATTLSLDQKTKPDSTKHETPEEEKAVAEPRQTKYERSGLSLEDAETYKIRLMQKMQEEELFLDSELTLPDLAKHTDLTPHQVSQVINGQMNQNFFSFVNNYRIQLAKKLMSEPDTRNMPIVELAVEVGFKSKSSFYDAFKKATQLTPTQFKKELDNT